MITVDRLNLRVPAMSEEQATRLAREVAEALRGWPAAPASVRLEHVNATVDPGAEATEPLARQIARAVMRAALQETGG